MSEHASTDHETDIATAFSTQEWSRLHQDDKVEGGIVVSLMASIFTVGLVLYSIVAVVVAS